MIEKDVIFKHYSNIANLLDDLIPCEWQRVALYAEQSEDKGFFTFYFENEYGEVYHWSDIPEEYDDYVYMEEFGENLQALEQAIKELWLECKNSDENIWLSFNFDIDSEWRFKVDFGYEITDADLPEWEKDIRWAYDTLGVIPQYANECNLLAKYLKEQGKELPDELKDEEPRYEERVVIKDTPEKYECVAEEMISFLEEFLKDLNRLEEEVNFRYNKLTQDKFKMGIESHIVAPGEDELDEEYHRRFYELAKDRCTEELLNQSNMSSWGNPPEHRYIEGDCQIVFMMKSASKAVIETQYHDGIEKRHQFVFKLTEAGWRIHEKKYAYGDEKTWHKTSF